MNHVAELRKRFVGKDGRFTKGSLSRLSEHLDCSRDTIKKCVFGDEHGRKWAFGKKKLELIERIITLEIPLLPIKPGPKTQNNC